MGAVHVDPKKVLAFEDERRFEQWLAGHWDSETEVWIRIFKVRSGVASVTPAQAIDVALCWGWIDGIRKGLDEQSFLQRYTPRAKKSVWSQINVANVARLKAAGRMQRPGLAQVAAAMADGRWDNAYSVSKTKPPDDLLAAIRAEPRALATYRTLSAQNRFALTFRTISMKTPAGRTRLIERFVEMLKKGQTIHPNGARGRATAPARPPSKRRRAQGVGQGRARHPAGGRSIPPFASVRSPQRLRVTGRTSPAR